MSVPSYIKLSPQMDTSTLVNALNTNFNQVQSQDRRKVITDENGDDRIVIGRQDDGSYAIKVSQDGVDVDNADDDQLVMSSEFNMWKIVRSGVISPVPRAGTVTLSGNNIGYNFSIFIAMDNFDVEAYNQTWIGKVLMNICYNTNKEPIKGSGLFYDDGTNQAFFDYSAELMFNSNLLHICFAVRLTKGSVTFTPTVEFQQSIYWQIANPTRDMPYGGGAGAPGAGKYVYLDTMVFNEDGTVKLPLASSTYEFTTGDVWQRWPQYRLRKVPVGA